MPFISVTGATGEGSQSLGGGLVTPAYVRWDVTSIPPKVRIIGLGTVPRALWGVGQVGLGLFVADGSPLTPDLLGQNWHIRQEHEIQPLVTVSFGPSNATTVWWRLANGVVVDIGVNIP